MNDNEIMEADKDLTIIYRILLNFEKQLDCETFDMGFISPENLNIKKIRRDRYLQMLIEAGYITGIKVNERNGETYTETSSPRITLKGIEYLAENSGMHRAMKILKEAGQMTVSIL